MRWCGVIFDPAVVTYEALLKVFWEGHDPTQGMRQGNDRGTQYRSGIYTHDDAQAQTAEASRSLFAKQLRALWIWARLRAKFCPRPSFTMRKIIISNT
jgi:peptide-methionine (S)-S-oxide reductase